MKQEEEKDSVRNENSFFYKCERRRSMTSEQRKEKKIMSVKHDGLHK